MTIFDIGEIKSIELKGDIKSGRKDGEIGGDIVVTTKDKKTHVIEIKCFSSEDGYTSKNTSNDKADFWILIDFESFRKYFEVIDIFILKDFNKYAEVISIDANKEKKLYLREVIETTKKMGGSDYCKCYSINLKSYFQGKNNIHDTGFFKW